MFCCLCVAEGDMQVNEHLKFPQVQVPLWTLSFLFPPFQLWFNLTDAASFHFSDVVCLSVKKRRRWTLFSWGSVKCAGHGAEKSVWQWTPLSGFYMEAWTSEQLTSQPGWESFSFYGVNSLFLSWSRKRVTLIWLHCLSLSLSYSFSWSLDHSVPLSRSVAHTNIRNCV